MPYSEYKNPDYSALSDEILHFWKQNSIFEQSISTREGKQAFTFFEGPPSANGMPGIHHVMSRAIKDIFCRYKTLKGFKVLRKGGWDTHGLPVELQVEKELGITKDDIGKKISVQEYNAKCKETVMKYTGIWNELTEKMGYWVDQDNPYITYEAPYIESCWHILKKLYEKDLLYKGYTIQPYSPAAGTGLSSHELNQPGTYQTVRDTSVVAQFKVIREAASEKLFESPDEQVYFLAWTTTPWTLPANSALAVGKNISYLKVKTYNPYTYLPVSVVLASDLMHKYFPAAQSELSYESYRPGDKQIPFRSLARFTGTELTGIRYEQLMPYVQPDTPAFRVITADYVSTEDGTGIVHISPTFGADDYRAAQQAGIPSIMVSDEDGNPMPLVDKKGRLVAQVTDFAGMYVKNYNNADEPDPAYKSTDVLISIKLKEENKAFKVEKYEHSYPHCWRTDKPILYYPMESWFIRTTAVKDRLVALNKHINWKPASTGSGRFGNWLENLVDWNLSRSRFWGTPLPIWRSEDGKAERCIGSIKELAELAEAANESGLLSPAQTEGNISFLESIKFNAPDLHRPFVDDIFLISPDKQVLKREADLIDVWFDSGAMPYAQWHFPFENKELFSENFPADFIAEGVDQTRGWFFTLHALSVMLYDEPAFRNVIANGLVLDKRGNKMSKRLGNAVDPFKTLKTYGPDAVRWYMIANAPPWENLKFNPEGIQEVQRKFFGTLQNTYSFFALYANLDGFSFAEPSIPLSERQESDRWIISKLNTLCKITDDAMAEYEPTRAARAIQDFVCDDLSNWYVRLNRKRFWKGEYNADKISAYQTLYTCLETTARLASPIAPFFAERMFLDLNEVTGQQNHASVHLTDFPHADFDLIDLLLEERMSMAQKISSLVHGIRKKHNLKVRQPLGRMLVPVSGPEERRHLQAVADLILSEVNIKELEFIDDASGMVVKRAKPNFKRLGKAFGPRLKQVADLISALNQAEIKQLETDGQMSFQLEDTVATITPEDAEILSEDIPGWITATENGLTVALDLTVSEELKQEGIARDVVNRLQNLRKEMGLHVLAKIKIQVEGTPEGLVQAALLANKEYICRETQALELNVVGALVQAIDFELDETLLRLQIEETAG